MKIKKKFDTFWNFIIKKGKNATRAAKKICDVYGYDAVLVRLAQSWFKRFQSENFDIKDKLALIDQSLEKSMKSKKKLSKTDTLAVMILIRN